MRDAVAAFTRAEQELTKLKNQAETLQSASTRLSEAETTMKEASVSLAGTATQISSLTGALVELAKPLAGYVTTLSEVDPKAILQRVESVHIGVEGLTTTMADHATGVRNQVKELQTAQDRATASAVEATATIQEQLQALGAQLQELRRGHEKATEERQRLRILIVVIAVLSFIAASAAITAALV